MDDRRDGEEPDPSGAAADRQCALLARLLEFVPPEHPLADMDHDELE